jgi:hypothetical protein
MDLSAIVSDNGEIVVNNNTGRITQNTSNTVY